MTLPFIYVMDLEIKDALVHIKIIQLSSSRLINQQTHIQKDMPHFHLCRLLFFPIILCILMTKVHTLFPHKPMCFSCFYEMFHCK